MSWQQKPGTNVYRNKLVKNGKIFNIESDASTGKIELKVQAKSLFGNLLDGDPVATFDPDTNKWTNVEGDDFKQFVDEFGYGNLARLQDDVRIKSFDEVFKDNASQEVKDKPGFKSRSGLANVPPEEGTGRGGPSDIQNPNNNDNNGSKTVVSTGGSKNSPFPQGTQGHYPIDIRETDQDRIKFQAVQLSGRNGAFNPTDYKSVAGPVFISMQGPIIDQNLVNWGDSKVFGGGGVAYGAASELLGKDGTDFSDEIKGKAKELKGNITELTAALAAGNMDIFRRETQQVFNPNLELIFKEPQLRPFNFQFKMSARGTDEAEEIKKIIRYFKYHMAPKGKGGDLFLKAPDVFWIEYQKGKSAVNEKGKLHPSLNLIAPEDAKKKACALQNMSVNYTPLGTYMTYDDEEATIVQYDISLSFREITPVYQVDYEEEPGKDHLIGY